MTTPPDLLEAARTDPTARAPLADCIQDSDGRTPAVDAALRMVCEVCQCPEMGGRQVCRGRGGRWVDCHDADDMNSSHAWEVFGPDYLFPRGIADPTEGTLHLYRAFDRWHLVCPHCRRSLVARRAAATRATNRATVEDAAPNLFSGVGDND